MKFRGVRVFGVQAIGDPYRADFKLCEAGVVGCKARKMVCVEMRGDDQGELAVSFFGEVIEAIPHCPDVGGVDSTVYQDVSGSSRGLGRHGKQEEVAETDAVHPHPDHALDLAALAASSLAGASFARGRLRWRGTGPRRPGGLAGAGLAGRNLSASSR